MFVRNLNERQQGVLLHYADEVMRVDRRIDAPDLMAMDMLRDQAEEGVKAEDVPIEQLPGAVRGPFESRVVPAGADRHGLCQRGFRPEAVGAGRAHRQGFLLP